MFKKINNITSLLLLTTSILAAGPAYASSYDEIKSLEGTIYNATAYKNGKFYIDGNIDKKNDVPYYLSNGKYNDILDFDSGLSINFYSSKYLNINNGEAFLNLDNGSISYDSIKTNSENYTASQLRKNIYSNNKGRYNGADASTLKDLDNKEIPSNKFSSPWYAVSYEPNNSTNNNCTALNIFTDKDGNYIDADYNLGLFKVTTTNNSTEKTTTIFNTNDKYEKSDSQKILTASVSSNPSDIIGQDDIYIYRFAKITISTSDSNTSISKINGLSLDNKSIFNTSNSNDVVQFDVIQKISKEQSTNTIDGAKYAKYVTSYFISKDNGASINKNSLLDHYTVSNGKLINYSIDSNHIKTQTIILSSKNEYYYTDITNQSTGDIAYSNGQAAIDTDTNGNLWRLANGFIYKWDNDDEWIKMYKVDTSFNKISVYDDNNIVVWSNENSHYSVIGGQQTTLLETAPLLNKGWVKTNDGLTFFNAAGIEIKNQWINDSGAWYYINENGIMATGWIEDDSNWYYLDDTGKMKTGWLNYKNNLYYLQLSGIMKTGWLKDNGNWYYFDDLGKLVTNTTIDGYNINEKGVLIK